MNTKTTVKKKKDNIFNARDSKMCFFRWTKKKPKFDQECMVICANKWNGDWEYSLYLITKVVFEDKWYWGWLTQDGEEYGDLADMQSQRYYVMPLLDGAKNISHN